MKLWVIMTVVAVVLPFSIYGKTQEQRIATENLVIFAQQNNIRAINCNQWDTDSDSYVSCSAKEKNEQLLQLECSGSLLSQNSGSCRFPKLNLQRGY